MIKNGSNVKGEKGFSGKLGFVLATAGSAVGLGNIWRFPYLAAKQGGGIFLFVYLILVFTFGFCLVITETALGRKTGKSALTAYGNLSSRWTFLGYFEVFIPMFIVPYYSLIGGWVIKYFFTFLTGQMASAATSSFFPSFISNTWSPLFWFVIFVVCTMLIVIQGVQKGIEKASKIIMPILVFLSLIIAIYSMSLPGAMAGVKYFLLPDFSEFSFSTVLSALGQMFYSNSIAMGILITYGSYMKKDVDMVSSVKQIQIFDTGIACMAALMIIPAVFAFSGGDPAALKAGAGLMFITLPKVFFSMRMGGFFGTLFFVLVFFAALTSSISLLEAIVSGLQEKFKWSRLKSCLMAGAFTIIVGSGISFGYGIWSGFTPFGFELLDFFDFITNAIFMPISAFLMCMFISKVTTVKFIVEEVELTKKFKEKNFYSITIKYIAPICIVLILVSSIMEAFKLISY